MKNFLKSTLLAATLTLGATAAMTTSASAADEVLTQSGVAVQGYDVIAYHFGQGPTLGSANYTTYFDGATYKFSSQSNLETFKANPAHYAPAYGGFCAFGVTKGKKFAIDPAAYTIVDGKLYLNKNKDVRKKWSKMQSEYISTAEENWQQIRSVAINDL